MRGYLTRLASYPLKSAAAVPLTHAELTPLGLPWDRRWQLVDPQGVFVSQRQQARMALLRSEVVDGVLRVSAPDMPTLLAIPTRVEPVTVSIWKDSVAAQTVSADANAWFSRYLDRDVRLVHFAASSTRAVDPDWAGEGHRTAFSDGFPLLVISQASFDELGRHWGRTVDWRRFRPNLVIGGDVPAYREDQCRGIRIGDVELAFVKPCSRCVIPSIDPDTTVKDPSLLTVLQQHRRREDGRTYLGQNAVMVDRRGGQTLRVGDPVEWLV